MIEVDATEMACPMHLLLAKRALNGMSVGERLSLRATDSTALRDVRVFVDQTDHLLVEVRSDDREHLFVIEKG